MLIHLWLFKEASQIVLLLLLTIKTKKEQRKKSRQLSGWEMQIATQKYHGRLLYNILDKNISTVSDEKPDYPTSKRLCKTNKNLKWMGMYRLIIIWAGQCPIQSLVPDFSFRNQGQWSDCWDKLVMGTKFFMMSVCENSHSVLLQALSALTAMIDTAF